MTQLKGIMGFVFLKQLESIKNIIKQLLLIRNDVKL